MTIKERLQKLVADLPDSVTWDEIQYRIYLQQVLEEGEREIDQGNDIALAEAEQRLARWLT